MTLCRPFIAATREEEGVDFFELHNDLGNSDGIVVVERYKSHEAHELHWTTPHFQAMWHIVQAIEGRFENIFADRVEGHREVRRAGLFNLTRSAIVQSARLAPRRDHRDGKIKKRKADDVVLRGVTAETLLERGLAGRGDGLDGAKARAAPCVRNGSIG